MSWGLQILAACASMAARDGSYALLTLAESKGRPLLSGLFDVIGDITGLAVTVFSAGEVITHGLNAHALVLLGCLFATSFVATSLSVKFGRGMGTA